MVQNYHGIEFSLICFDSWYLQETFKSLETLVVENHSVFRSDKLYLTKQMRFRKNNL